MDDPDLVAGTVPRGLLLNGKWYSEEHTLGSNLDTNSSRRSQKKKKQKLISEKVPECNAASGYAFWWG
ncbi:unnamed protein product [Prunus armeniaca]